MKDFLKIKLHIKIRKYPLLILIIITAIYFIYRNIDIVRECDNYLITWGNLTSNISCYYAEEGDALPSIADPRISPGTNSIFFHETTCRGGLNSRQACAVESAARAHPNRNIYVLFNSPVTRQVLNKSCITKLLQFKNVRVARVRIMDYCTGTPIKALMRNIKYYKDPLSKTAEILRIVTLNKYGGIYLDFDMLVLKSLDKLGLNWIVKTSERSTESGIIALDHGYSRLLTGMIMHDMAKYFKPRDRIYLDPDAVSHIVSNLCPGAYSSTAYDCNGLKVYSKDLFIPIARNLWYAYFDARDMDDLYTPLTHCMWNEESDGAYIDKLSPYAKLAMKYCPTIYEMYGDQFGN